MSGDQPGRDEAVLARRLRVGGQVQGVFYRDSCRHEADRLGVRGWVRNAVDGAVEVHAEGRPDVVAALTEWCGHGPPKARVEHVSQERVPPEGYDRFTVR